MITTMTNATDIQQKIIDQNDENSNKTSGSNSCDKSFDNNYKVEIVWRNVIVMLILHTMAIYGFYLGVTGVGKWGSLMYGWFITFLSSIGVLAGAHRLWTHRTYKAKIQLRIMLAIFQTMALQNDLYEWCRDHRVHHKYSETDADPHNARRGFFFSHIGWLLCKKHPQVKEKGKLINLSDLWEDPVVRFQRRFYIPLVIVFWAIVPMIVPIYVYKEDVFATICGNAFRYVYSLHMTWLVNSLAHLYGSRPYDKGINPRESKAVIYLTNGEGYHNYHHVFPYDYSASEFGWRENWNPATAFIDFFAWIGWAYDRRTAPKPAIEQKIKSCGDQSSEKIRLNTWLDFIVGFAINIYLLILMFVLRLMFAK